MGCGGKSSVKLPPAWIDNPQQGVSASSGMHVKGRHYQQELAIVRAREQLAARMGVEVSSVQTVKEQVANQQASIRTDKVTQLVVKNQLGM